ncbi:hypothetical protein [Emergencia sp.]|uniref:hypothetical protein n=1 Tax=Emergencia sp. TaxID=1926557 RepID=UPI003AF1D92C
MNVMLNLIKVESKKIFRPVLFTTAILAVAMCVLTCTLYKSYTLQYDLEAWEVGTELFSLLYPLIAVVPLCWNLYYERKNNFLLYVQPRVPIKKYLAVKWGIYALGAFCMIAIPYTLSAVFALYVKAPVVPFTNPFDHVFQKAFTQMPLLYGVILSCWKGVLGILMMTFGYVLAMYGRNIFVILTGPFVYSILENYILSILRLEQYRLVVAFDPTSISDDAISVMSFLAGPAFLAVVIFLTAFFLSKVRGNAVVTV